MQATIKAVSSKPRVWDGPKGKLHFINVVFEDGSQGDYGAKPETSQQHIEALQALIGKPGDFEMEQREFQGERTWKIKSYPGQTVGKGGGFGGKREYVPAWTQTEAGERYTQERMDRRTSLMQAVEIVTATTSLPNEMLHYPDTLQQADAFYQWLRESDQKPQNAAYSPVRQVEAVQGGRTAKDAPYINLGPGQCMTCHAPAGKPHGKQCLES